MFSRRRLITQALGSGSFLYGCNKLSPTSLISSDDGTDGDLGVASGDPGQDSVVLWTRIPKKFQPGAGSAEILCEVATVPEFPPEKIVFKTSRKTDDSGDFCVRIQAQGLQPATTYFYRFSTDSGYKSVVGRTRTAPLANDNRPVKFAVVSCQDFSNGYFLPYKAIAAGDFDFVLHLGDFIYEKGGDAVRSDVIGGGQAKSLAEFRHKYRLYLQDRDLREARRLFPFVHLWDDHEVEDNYAGPDYVKNFPQLIGNGYQAFFDYMPITGVVTHASGAVSAPMTRSLRFGAALELFVLDQRQFRDPKVCKKDLLARSCPEISDPNRTMLGTKQRSWLTEKMAESSAVFKLIASELMVMPVRTPSIPLLSNQDFGGGFGLKDAELQYGFENWNEAARYFQDFEKLSENAVPPIASDAAEAESTSTYMTLDSWDGYPAERRHIINEIAAKKITNAVVVSGDIHNFFAGRVHTDPEDASSPAIASEVTTASVTSKGVADYIGNIASTVLKPGIALKNKHIDSFDLKYRGYVEISVSDKALSGRMVAFESVVTIQGTPFVLSTFGVQSGKVGFKFS